MSRWARRLGTKIWSQKNRMITGSARESQKRSTKPSRGARQVMNSWARPMWRASSATWVCITRRSSGCRSSPERRIDFCTWSIGSSPASTPRKNPTGSYRATSGRNGAGARKSRVPPSWRGSPAASVPRRPPVAPWLLRRGPHPAWAATLLFGLGFNAGTTVLIAYAVQVSRTPGPAASAFFVAALLGQAAGAPVVGWLLETGPGLAFGAAAAAALVGTLSVTARSRPRSAWVGEPAAQVG